MDSSANNTHTFFGCLSPGSGAAAATAIAEILADGLDPLQINALGGFLAVVSQVLSYIATQKQLNETMCPKRAAPAATAAGNTGSENTEENAGNTRSENTGENEGNTGSENTEKNAGNIGSKNIEKNADNIKSTCNHITQTE